ncbi:zinc finger protein 704-like [Paramacrobiotus metropolitanus]|uniref:zinc finger protein 704-like n=1 Tax=Paramacrobiotus metropolitanus TaxID=2943436 RepID=UPI0024458172|nr:zinc finger protein 704-like [Paramacrobiotus metropolitanus]
MSSSKRPAKRSLIGLRVAAKRDTGFYEPATVADVTNKQVAGASFAGAAHPAQGDKLLLKFDDGNQQWYLERQIIGQGFQSINSACLPVGQLVYCTVGHRETSGRIVGSVAGKSPQVFEIALEDGSERRIQRKQDDMRLIKSRKSARITADKDKDYHSLALGKIPHDISLESLPELPVPSFSIATNRKRSVPVAVETNFDVLSIPGPLDTRAYRELNDVYESPDADSDESNLGERGGSAAADGQGDVLMDECSAALVLMSLGASSPGNKLHMPPQLDLHEDAGFQSGTSCPSTYGSSWPSERNMGRQRQLSNSTGSSGPTSGVSSLHRPISPASFHDSTSTTASSDEGIEMASSMSAMDHDYAAGWPEASDFHERPRKRRPSNSVVFQCTWPECQHMESTRAGVTKHIQNVHFASAGLPADDLEFYYNEIDGSSHSGSSPPVLDLLAPHSHFRLPPGTAVGGQRQRSTLSASSDGTGGRFGPRTGSAKPITIPHRPATGKRHEWESASAPQYGHSDMHSLSPSAIRHLQKGRDVKKCRKVYGMENREMWCTQCKWKKACTRFAELNA